MILALVFGRRKRGKRNFSVSHDGMEAVLVGDNELLLYRKCFAGFVMRLTKGYSSGVFEGG